MISTVDILNIVESGNANIANALHWTEWVKIIKSVSIFQYTPGKKFYRHLLSKGMCFLCGWPHLFSLLYRIISELIVELIISK